MLFRSLRGCNSHAPLTLNADSDSSSTLAGLRFVLG
jgi:hypothetical protein